MKFELEIDGKTYKLRNPNFGDLAVVYDSFLDWPDDGRGDRGAVRAQQSLNYFIDSCTKFDAALPMGKASGKWHGAGVIVIDDTSVGVFETGGTGTLLQEFNLALRSAHRGKGYLEGISLLFGDALFADNTGIIEMHYKVFSTATAVRKNLFTMREEKTGEIPAEDSDTGIELICIRAKKRDWRIFRIKSVKKVPKPKILPIPPIPFTTS